MKKSITFYLSIFIANTAWGDCSLTNATLKQGGTVNYDDYLYPDSMQYELRNENNPNSKAYLCGAGYCAVGTKIRLPNAKAGNSYTISDAVYECKNSSSSGRTSYQWVVSAVDSNCIITPPQISKTVSPMEVKNAGTLYMVGSKYCSSVNEVHKEAGTNFWDAAKSSGHDTAKTIQTWFNGLVSVNIATINGGIEIIKNNTERMRIFTNGTVSVINNNVQTAGQIISSTWESTTDGFVKIHDINSRTVIGGLQIAKDGTVKIFNSTSQVITTIAKERGESYRATLGFFGGIIGGFNADIQTAIKTAGSVVNTGIKETGATIRNFFDNSTSFSISAINGGVELAKNNTERIRIFTNGTVSVINTVTQTTGQTISSTWETTKDGIVKIHDINSRTFIGGLQIAKDGTVKIITSTNKVIMTLAKESGESYRATLGFFGGIISNFNDTVQTTIKSAAQVAGVTIHELAETARSAMNNATDFAKHFTTEIVGGVKAYGINKAKLKELEERIAKCQTQEQVAELIAKALREAELSEAQCAQVRQMINQYAQTQNQRFDVIEGKLGSLEQELREIQQQNIEFSYQIANLGSQYNSLAAEVRTKVSAKQVINLINERTQSFSEGQKRELYVILGEYTKKLSDGQRAEVQQMIALYVDPKIAQLGGRIDLESNRRVAENKVLSAMSTLNAFAASAKVSVWKTADGKFNGARLASDSIAGVVLGTAGGLISNALIKKSQTKKGFDDIRCSVAGQFVAEYDDEFVVGMQ